LIEVRELKKDKTELLEFINFPWIIYEKNPHWVPPIKTDLLKSFLEKNSKEKINCGPHAFFMAWEDGTPLGRILVGINEKKNLRINKNVGFFGYLEMINSPAVLSALMGQAFDWLKRHNIDSLIGPLCPDDDVEGRGILIEGFDSPPVLMNPYNPPYYQTLLEGYGFSKDMEFYAYYTDKISSLREKVDKVSDFAQQKFKFTIDKADLKFREREIRDIAEIVNQIILSDNEEENGFEYAVPPTYESLYLEMNKLLPFLDQDLLYIARAGEKPIGFVFAIPDYNQVLKRLNGKLFPFGLFKFLWYKRKISGIRGFAQFVVPEYQNKAVVAAIFKQLLEVAERKNYKYIEGSQIEERNLASRRIFENAGIAPYKTYRVYRKNNKKD